MKNRIFKAALAAIAVVSMAGCAGYLDRAPLDSNSDATNWTSEAALENYSWNLTEDLHAFSYGRGWTKGQFHNEAFSDDYDPTTFSPFTQNVPGSSSQWNTPYDKIRMANILLSRVDLVPNLSEEAANHWRGVARFFRALYHFELVKTYGDVVWVDGEVDFSKEENITRPRDSRVLVMDNVIADLQFAMNNCRGPQGPASISVNNMVAAALLSRAALFEGAYEKYHGISGGHPETFYQAAKQAGEKIINSGVYEIGNDYKKAYTSVDLSGNKEVIMYKIYTLANVNGGKVSEANAMCGWSISSDATLGLTKSAVENYATADGLPIHMVDYDDTTVDGVFANRDLRLSATVCPTNFPITGMTYVDGIISNSGYWTWKFIPWERKDQMKSNGTWNAPYNDIDGPIFLYSEVLENYAEACAELGQCDQGVLDRSINVLRKNHGGIPALTVSGTNVSVNGVAITKDPKDPSANVLIQEIRRDRRSELMCDGLRGTDIKRWKLGDLLDFTKNPDGYLGATKSLIKEYYDSCIGSGEEWSKSYSAEKWQGTVVDQNFWVNDYKSAFNTVAAGGPVSRTWDDKYYLEPIPANQITLDGNLTQNPGW